MASSSSSSTAVDGGGTTVDLRAPQLPDTVSGEQPAGVDEALHNNPFWARYLGTRPLRSLHPVAKVLCVMAHRLRRLLEGHPACVGPLYAGHHALLLRSFRFFAAMGVLLQEIMEWMTEVRDCVVWCVVVVVVVAGFLSPCCCCFSFVLLLFFFRLVVVVVVIDFRNAAQVPCVSVVSPLPVSPFILCSSVPCSPQGDTLQGSCDVYTGADVSVYVCICVCLRCMCRKKNWNQGFLRSIGMMFLQRTPVQKSCYTLSLLHRRLERKCWRNGRLELSTRHSAVRNCAPR